MSTYVYIPPTETETRFVEWLAKLSRGVEWKYMRWLLDNDGGLFETNNGGDFCYDCVEIQKFVNRHERNGFTQIDGWNESFPSDSPRWCERCGILLCHSLTEYGISEEIGGLSEPGRMLPGDAAIIHNFLDGIGDYQRDKHWPLIEPHAIRLMSGKCDLMEPATEEQTGETKRDAIWNYYEVVYRCCGFTEWLPSPPGPKLRTCPKCSAIDATEKR